MLRLALPFLIAPFAVLAIGVASGRADTIGWQIEARACRGETCRTLPMSRDLWHGRYACTGRAAHLQSVASDMPPSAFGLPRGVWRITTRCVDVPGLPRA